jgi:hypothetical protein
VAFLDRFSGGVATEDLALVRRDRGRTNLGVTVERQTR